MDNRHIGFDGGYQERMHGGAGRTRTGGHRLLAADPSPAAPCVPCQNCTGAPFRKRRAVSYRSRLILCYKEITNVPYTGTGGQGRIRTDCLPLCCGYASGSTSCPRSEPRRAQALLFYVRPGAPPALRIMGRPESNRPSVGERIEAQLSCRERMKTAPGPRQVNHVPRRPSSPALNLINRPRLRL